MASSHQNAFLVNSAGQRVSILSGTPLRIGRDPDNDLSIPDDSVSRHHAVITLAGTEPRLKDLGSSNGTYVNGLRLREGSLALTEGDSVKLGGVVFIVRINESVGKNAFCTKCGRLATTNTDHCGYCGAGRLRTFGGSTSSDTDRSGGSAYSGTPCDGTPAANYELPLLLIPIGASFIAWFWVGNMSLIQGPQSWLGLLTTLTVLSTAAVAAAEANKVGMKYDRPRGIYGPGGWFIAMVGIWAIAYPVYLFKRRYYGLENRILYGLGAMLLFALTTIFIRSATAGRIPSAGGFSSHTRYIPLKSICSINLRIYSNSLKISGEVKHLVACNVEIDTITC
jgi:hypothetical protein